MFASPARPTDSDPVVKWLEYATHLENKLRNNSLELAKLKNIVLMNHVTTNQQHKENDNNNNNNSTKTTTETKQQQQPSSATFPSSFPVTTKQPLASSSESLKPSISPTKKVKSPSSSSSSLSDPVFNGIIVALKRELDESLAKQDELQIELDATKFNPDSQLTKRLMFKCNKLLDENAKIGKLISSGNVAQLENDLAYHKRLLAETQDNEQNINSFLLEIDNEMDVMHSKFLQVKSKQREDISKS